MSNDLINRLHVAVHRNDRMFFQGSLHLLSVSDREILFIEILVYGKPEYIPLILKTGVDINCRDPDGFTALYTSIACGKPQCVEKLLQYGANVDLLSVDETPLMTAIICNEPECVQILLENGANLEKTNLDNETPLNLANQNEQISILIWNEIFRRLWKQLVKPYFLKY